MVHNTPPARMAQVVTAALEDAGLSERQASELAAIPRTTLKRKMRTGDFTVTELAAIASAVGTTVAALAASAEDAA